LHSFSFDPDLNVFIFCLANTHGPGPGAYNPYEPLETKTPIDLVIIKQLVSIKYCILSGAYNFCFINSQIIEEHNKRFFEAKVRQYIKKEHLLFNLNLSFISHLFTMCFQIPRYHISLFTLS
jgi:hypothetical protein